MLQCWIATMTVVVWVRRQLRELITSPSQGTKKCTSIKTLFSIKLSMPWTRKGTWFTAANSKSKIITSFSLRVNSTSGKSSLIWFSDKLVSIQYNELTAHDGLWCKRFLHYQCMYINFVLFCFGNKGVPRGREHCRWSLGHSVATCSISLWIRSKQLSSFTLFNHLLLSAVSFIYLIALYV